MFFVSNCCLAIFSILILMVIYVSAYSQNEEFLFQNRLYLYMVKVTMILVVVNIFSRFDGKPDTIYWEINHIGNFLLYLIQLCLPSIWLLYTQFQIYQDERRTKKLAIPLVILIMINAVLVIVSQFNGCVYYIDSENVFHRGGLDIVVSLVLFSILLWSCILLIRHRKKIEYRYFRSLIFFVIPPIICVPIQMYYIEADILLPVAVLSMLIIFINIQNRYMSEDYLTGVYNRKQLDWYIDKKIKDSTKDKSFAAIFIDLDHFKKINDNFGHHMGDDALVTVVELLKKSIKKHDFIARFGGDEFIVVLNMDQASTAKNTVNKITRKITTFNLEHKKPYQLSLSMGFLIYDSASGMDEDEFLKQIDDMMYENKRKNKEKQL